MRSFKIINAFIGRNETGDRLYVSAEWDGTRLSFNGEMFEEKGRSSGQIEDKIRPVAPTLANLWKRWHLNDLRAGCEHQESLFRESPELRPTWANEYKGMTKPCPDCGYTYGSQWNIEVVPEEVVREVHDLLKAYKALDVA